MTENIDIVLVHLGVIPKYLYSNIEYLCKTFANKNIKLVTDNEKIKNIKYSNFEYINYSEIDENIELNLSKLKHSRNFRNGFWFKTIERFFYLEEYLSKHNRSIIYLESDVLLFPNFPFSKFQLVKKEIAYPLVSQARGIASCMYIKNSVGINNFCNFIKSSVIIDNSNTDMTLLGNYQIKYPERVYILPTYIESDSFFEGIFDGASIGIYLEGTDPLNYFGISKLKRIYNDHDFKPDKYRYHSEKGLINLIDSKRCIPIYNLHVHSKRKKVFKTNKKRVQIIFFKKKYRNKRFKIYPKIFFSVCLNFVRKKISSYVSSINVN